jgi:hypothetical protein
MSQKLRDLIRSVRACKTAGDERAVRGGRRLRPAVKTARA